MFAFMMMIMIGFMFLTIMLDEHLPSRGPGHDQLVLCLGQRLSWLFFCRYSPSLRPEDLILAMPIPALKAKKSTL